MILSAYGAYIASAMLSITLFLLFRDMSLRRSGDVAWTVVNVLMAASFIATALLLWRAYIPIYGSGPGGLAACIWMTMCMLAREYFIMRPARARKHEES